MLARGIVFLTLLLAAAAAVADGKVQRVTVQGSSTVYPIGDAIATELEIGSGRSIEVVIAVSGSSRGIASLCRGEADIAAASRPILADEAGRCLRAGVRFIELPFAYDALTVVVNPANDFVTALSVAQLARVWAADYEGEATRWSDIDPAWPARPIRLYAPDRASGTHDYFDAAVLGAGKSSRGDYSSSDSDYALAQRVARDPDALGYFGFPYYAQALDRLRAVPIRAAGAETAVAPSPETVQRGEYRPLTRPLFLYVSAKAYARRPVQRYVDLFVSRVPAIAAELNYVPLGDALYRAVADRLERRIVGSAFDGLESSEVPLERLLDVKVADGN